jgi:hypothetical protein
MLSTVMSRRAGITAIQGETTGTSWSSGQQHVGRFRQRRARCPVPSRSYNLERVGGFEGPQRHEFGRGGGGGVVNRVTKEAGFATFA